MNIFSSLVVLASTDENHSTSVNFLRKLVGVGGYKWLKMFVHDLI